MQKNWSVKTSWVEMVGWLRSEVTHLKIVEFKTKHKFIFWKGKFENQIAEINTCRRKYHEILGQGDNCDNNVKNDVKDTISIMVYNP
jgi:hypothetical protein